MRAARHSVLAGAQRSQYEAARRKVEAAMEKGERTQVHKRWHCCGGELCNKKSNPHLKKSWRKMIWILIIVVVRRRGVAGLLNFFLTCFSFFFSPALRKARKVLGLVEPQREHSFGFMQARPFVATAILHLGIYRETNGEIELELVGAALFMIEIGLLEERDVDGVKVCCFDGDLVQEVNARCPGDKKRCKLSVEVTNSVSLECLPPTPSTRTTLRR